MSVVIVIDPGHGGENEGAKYNGNVEKYVTMETAQAMKEELERYDGVEVYLTHEDPELDMSLEERADFAEEVNADFLISCHYNAKEYHDMYGCEVWIPMKGEINSEAYRFSRFVLDEWTTNFDLFNRGIKTREGNSGEYYGILRHCVDREIPAVILEHAHFDNDVDWEFVDGEDDFKKFGVCDATAVAKFFGLKSTQLGVDYSESMADKYPVEAGINYAKEDKTVPEVCELAVQNVDYDNNQVTLNIHVEDPESPIYYYAVSTDGGKTFNPLLPWPEYDIYTGEYASDVTVTVDMRAYTDKTIVVKVFNQFDRKEYSNPVVVKGVLPELLDVAEVQDEAVLQAQKDLRLALVSELSKAAVLNMDGVYDSMFTVEPLSDEVKARITGISYPTDDSGAKIHYDDLRYLRLVYKNFDGENRLGEMICNKSVADDVSSVFKELYAIEYPIEKIKLVDEYGGDDTASMDDNNTSCFNYRVVENTDRISNHGLGIAIDLNPLYNPYVSKNPDGSLHVSPEAGEPYADRGTDCPYLINKTDSAYKIFNKYGFTWGGSWKNVKDYQHFERK